MDLGPHLDAIRSDLEALAGADEALHEAMARLGRPLEASMQLRLLDVLSEASLELSSQLPSGHVDLRVAGRDAGLVFVGPPELIDAPASAADEEGGTARLTLRMPDALKSSVEAASDADGLSVNAWLVRAVKRALDRPGRATAQERRPDQGLRAKLSAPARSRRNRTMDYTFDTPGHVSRRRADPFRRRDRPRAGHRA